MPKPSRKQQQSRPAPGPTRMFTFGEPEQVLTANIGEYLGVFATDDGRLYKPPVSRAGLAKLLRANAHHGAIPKFKRNLLLREFLPSAGCSTYTMGCAALDYMVFGEAYFLGHENFLGHVLELEHLPAINMRVKVDGGFVMLLPNGKEQEFDQDEVIHIKDYDVEQNIYGIPDYLGGLQALLLNEAATLFRRRYYSNGAHAGYIFYTNDPNLSEEDEENLRAQISASKGVGNFRSMFVNIPGGQENAIKIIPVGDFQAKDELEKVKNITRNDIIAAWRMNPALAGIIPENTGGFGDIEKIDRVYTNNEIRPICQLFDHVNEVLRDDRRISWREVESAAG
ncbi:phage portal protein [Pseudomonas palleroniana]|uniref:Phage portal protein n=1 Tax=Pseudomonas palleroniana TaxID=191390 RepID=A0A2T4FQC8_9PSED|nr:phage portal protein [Pseudomonas palleroniana]PTC25568.1 phage portal protein [Pseudomonas palleroniana]